jgi:preprotein translocase subunit SecE
VANRLLWRSQVASQTKKVKKDNAVVKYFRETRAELKKVRWPTLEQGWSMTKLVLIVTFAMAVFLGVLDFFFGWLLQGVILAQNVLYIILSVLVILALVGAAVLIGQGEQA